MSITIIKFSELKASDLLSCVQNIIIMPARVIKLQAPLLMLVCFLGIATTFNETYSNSSLTYLSNSTLLYFGLMLSLSGDHQSSGALAGVQAALDEINSRDDLLSGYLLNYTLTDSKVRIEVAIAISFYMRGIAMYY